MRILLITDEVWNDRIHGNNVLTNWFENFPAKFAQIYCSPGVPDNKCCDKYYQLTDKMMVDSIIKGTLAGKCVNSKRESIKPYKSTDVNNIGFLRKYCGNTLRFLKNIVWTIGNYNEETLKEFVINFSPDLIFTPRMATPKLLRLERSVYKYANCPMVAFTGDNEYSLQMFSLSPIAWINKFWVRKELRDNTKLYSIYYTLSDEQKEEYEKIFKCPIKILRKCENSPKVIGKSDIATINHPIRLVYAGKLYCNRWKTLAVIGKALSKINKEECRVVLDIYTKDSLTKKQKDALDYPGSIQLHGAISSKEVLEKYRNSDIALHIESFDLKYKLATRVSFSTKIIDCLSGGCALMVVAWKKHSGLTYLKKEDAAICIDNLKEVYNVINALVHNEEILNQYKEKAMECLKKNHDREKVQKKLFQEWSQLLENSRGEDK